MAAKMGLHRLLINHSNNLSPDTGTHLLLGDGSKYSKESDKNESDESINNKK